jgi:hypothetical protein
VAGCEGRVGEVKKKDSKYGDITRHNVIEYLAKATCVTSRMSSAKHVILELSGNEVELSIAPKMLTVAA